MGMYEDDFFKFGTLGSEMLRACRLVVDTGIHSKNWTRQQGIDFMLGKKRIYLYIYPYKYLNIYIE